MNAACEQFDVAIVGLGPTGLTLAHTLGMRGLQVLVLEREPKSYGNARAVYTDGECMRIFQSFGMAHTLAADMLQDVPVQMVLPDGSVLLQIKNTHQPYGWSTANFFYQPALETALAEGLTRYPNVKVLRGREVTRFEQDASGGGLPLPRKDPATASRRPSREPGRNRCPARLACARSTWWAPTAGAAAYARNWASRWSARASPTRGWCWTSS
jgi:2-polyprenyl-6-methoxyphenol hydroxylase-like FAD-dependent oxidoreductase